MAYQTGFGAISRRTKLSQGCPQFDTLLNRNQFDEDGEKHVVKRGEHDDPRELVEDAHWGLGFLSSLTEVVEEDVTTEEESSSEVSSSDVSDNSFTSSDEDVGPVKPPVVFSCTDIRYR